MFLSLCVPKCEAKCGDAAVAVWSVPRRPLNVVRHDDVDHGCQLCPVPVLGQQPP